MNDILEFLDELKELQTLYDNGDLRNIDFAMKIQKYENQIQEFEKQMEKEADQFDFFFKDTPFYNPTQEV